MFPMMKKASISFFIAFLFAPSVSGAETDIAGLNRQIESLTAIVEALKTEIGARDQAPLPVVPQSSSPAFVFSRSLMLGISGKDVSELQTFLAKDSILYPEGLITGYFGPLTEQAVKNLQARHGIEAIGIVGPKTRALIHSLLSSSTSGAPSQSVIPAAPPLLRESDPESALPPPPFPPPPPALNERPSYDLRAFEKRIQEVVSEERARFALPPLLWDENIAELARLHSISQAKDNIEITRRDAFCHYPIIRHEGFDFGYNLKERLINKQIDFLSAGENIAMYPLFENRRFTFSASVTPPPECQELSGFPPGEGSQAERVSLYEKALAESAAAARDSLFTGWIGMSSDWRESEKIVRDIVDGWMNSEGHRANILNAKFAYGGIGVAEINDYIIATHVMLFR